MSNKMSRITGAILGTVALAAAAGYEVRAQSQSQTGANAQASREAQSITVTGCIQREADYRRAAGAGRGGAVGTGVGTGNEFVLANATMGAAAGAATGTSGAGATAATGTTGAAAAGTAYELTGPQEGKAEGYVGKRVEITGTLKASTSGATGGPTANVPGSQDLKLRELEVASIREATGTCTVAP